MADLGNKSKKQQSTDSIEKYFFAYILENPKFFQRVEPMNFQNPKIKFIFERIRTYYLSQEKGIVPSNHKIYELIRMDDPDANAIPNDYLKSLLNVDIADMVQGEDDNFLKNSFYSWCTSNQMKIRMYEAIDWIRDMNQIDYDNTKLIAEKLKEAMGNATLMNYGDENIGLDFFDVDAHVQNTAQSKISTGWGSIDELLNGGWSRKTLNIITGGSNSGKSLWLCNIAVNGADSGKNVLYVTLEMADTEVMKRTGSKWLRIPIDEYDNKSKDKVFMQRKLKELTSKSAMHSDNIFDTSIGQLFVKEFPSGTCSVDDIDNHIKLLEEVKGIKIDMVVVDYLTIMQPEKGDRSSLFTNGKYLSNGLRAIAQTRDLVMVTAMQISKDSQSSNDINMADMSESKAIYENADIIFGIIRSDIMRKEKKYILKLLKLRNGSFKWEKTHFDFNDKFLSMENDKKMDFI